MALGAPSVSVQRGGEGLSPDGQENVGSPSEQKAASKARKQNAHGGGTEGGQTQGPGWPSPHLAGPLRRPRISKLQGQPICKLPVGEEPGERPKEGFPYRISFL